MSPHNINQMMFLSKVSSKKNPFHALLGFIPKVFKVVTEALIDKSTENIIFVWSKEETTILNNENDFQEIYNSSVLISIHQI